MMNKQDEKPLQIWTICINTHKHDEQTQQTSSEQTKTRSANKHKD